MIEEAGFESGEGELGVLPIEQAIPAAAGKMLGTFTFDEPMQVAPGDRIRFELTVDFDDEATVKTVQWLPSGAIIAHPN